MRLKLGIDLDCTLNSLPRDLREYFSRTERLKHLRLSDEDYNFRRLEDVWNVSVPEVKKIHFDYLTSDFYKTTAPLDGSVDVIRRLSSQHDLYVVTFRREAVRQVTEEWLERNFGRSFKEVICTDEDRFKTKAEACKAYGIDLVVDDSPHHIRSFVESGIPVIYFSGLFSQEIAKKIMELMPKEITEARTWSEVEEILKNKRKK